MPPLLQAAKRFEKKSIFVFSKEQYIDLASSKSLAEAPEILIRLPLRKRIT